MNYKIILIFLTIIALLSALIFPNFLFLFAKNSFGFFNGYSASKLIYFIFLLLILTIIPTYNKFKNKNYLEKISKIKNLNKKIAAIFVILITLSTISTITFQTYNDFEPFNLAYVIYDDEVGVFTGTSITHIHTFKPVLGAITNFLPTGEYDVAPSILAFMPGWINIIYFIGIILLLAFIYFAILYAHIFFLEKEIDYFGLWIYVAGFYLVSKTIVDGGILTAEFLIGSVFFIWILFFYKNKHSKKYFSILTLSILLIDFLIRYSLVNTSKIILNNAQLFNLITKGIITLTGLLFFVGAIGILIYYLTKEKTNKKTIRIIFIILVGFILFSTAFSTLGIEKAIKENDIELVNKIIPKETTIAFLPYAIDPNAPIEIVNSNNELVFATLKKDSTIAQLSIWKRNIKSKDYIYPWKNSCAIPIIEKEIIFNTKNELKKINTESSIFVLNEKKIGENTYKLKILHSKCITDIRGVLVEYLKSRGAKQFIVYN